MKTEILNKIDENIYNYININREEPNVILVSVVDWYDLIREMRDVYYFIPNADSPIIFYGFKIYPSTIINEGEIKIF
jgi:hypothetical protein